MDDQNTVFHLDDSIITDIVQKTRESANHLITEAKDIDTKKPDHIFSNFFWPVNRGIDEIHTVFSKIVTRFGHTADELSNTLEDYLQQISAIDQNKLSPTAHSDTISLHHHNINPTAQKHASIGPISPLPAQSSHHIDIEQGSKKRIPIGSISPLPAQSSHHIDIDIEQPHASQIAASLSTQSTITPASDHVSSAIHDDWWPEETS